MGEITKAQGAALKWLAQRSGSGMFNRNGVLLAQGELAGVMRVTWNSLRDAGYVSIDKKRVTITDAANSFLRGYHGPEADTVDEDE